MAELMSPPVAKYFQLLLIHFVQKIAAIQEELIDEFSDRKMQLFLEYDRLIEHRMASFISGEF